MSAPPPPPPPPAATATAPATTSAASQPTTSQVKHVKYDAGEHKAYIQKHRIWVLGDMVTKKVLSERPPENKAVLTLIVNTLKEEASKVSDKPLADVDPPAAGEVGPELKEYLLMQKLPEMIEAWLKHLLDTRPEKAIDASVEYFEKLLAACA